MKTPGDAFSEFFRTILANLTMSYLRAGAPCGATVTGLVRWARSQSHDWFPGALEFDHEYRDLLGHFGRFNLALDNGTLAVR